MNSNTWRAVLAQWLLWVGACGSGSSTGPQAPTLERTGQATCKVRKSQLRPLVVEWPSADRAALEARAQTGLVVVRYTGCEMQLLPQCQVKDAGYSYVGVTRKKDRIAILDQDQLWANMPIGAAGLEATLEQAGQLNVSMTIVGRLQTQVTHVSPDDLEGTCDNATHVLASLTVGAFELSTEAKRGGGAGVKAAGIGVGASRKEQHSTLTADGDLAACEQAKTGDDAPPAGCAALLRVEALPLGERTVREPLCPRDTHWDGEQCVREQVVTRVRCPEGMRLEANGCVSASGVIPTAPVAAGACPANMVFIPAGAFALPTADGSTKQVDVGDLCMDRTEVTAGAYLSCVKAGVCTRTYKQQGCIVLGVDDPGTGTPLRVPSTADNPKLADHPMNCVTQREASRYCSHVGKRLPEEGEWVWAARSGALARPFAWGSSAGRDAACWQRRRQGPCRAGERGTDRTAQGVLDMTGNLSEWTSTHFRSFPIARGGSFFTVQAEHLNVATPPRLVKTAPRAQLGFRCVK